MPAFGTCAGMILLATEIVDGRPDQPGSARSTSACAATPSAARSTPSRPTWLVTGLDGPLHAVFIRAPVVEWVGPGWRCWPG